VNSALRITVVILALLMLVVACDKAATPVDYTHKRVTLTDEDRTALVGAARQCLEEGKIDSSAFSSTLNAPYNKDVFVYAFGAGNRPMHMRAHEKTIAASLEKACSALYTNDRFSRKFKGKMKQARIGVYIMDDLKEVNTRSVKKMKRIIEPGVHGLMVSYKGELGYQLGEEVLFNGWGMKGFGDRDRVSGSGMEQRRLERLCRAADWPHTAWKDKVQSRIWHFTTHTALEMEPGGKVFESYRAFMLWPKEITRSRLLESAWLAGRHLAMHTDKKGKLGYHYRPVRDEFAKDKYYNIVRHAGSVWGLFTAYNATGDRFLFEAGQRALTYLENEIKIAEEDPEVAFLDYRGRSYLGTNALTLLSLIEIPNEALTPKLLELRTKLGNGLIAFQVEDGRFYKSWREVMRGGPVPDPQPRYFPGEAFLALVKFYEIDRNEKWLTAASKCAAAQMREWDSNPKQQPDAWVVQAMSRLYPFTNNEKLPEYVFKMVEWHFHHQWGMPEKGKRQAMPYADYFGGADNSTPPRSTPTSARNEANTEAWHLARRVGNAEMEKRLGDSVMAALWHNSVDQFRPETSYFLSDPEKALGGIRGSLISNDIRIDYNQHFLSAAINGLDLAEERYGVGELGPLSSGKIIDVHKAKIDPAEAAKQLSDPTAETEEKAGEGEK